MFAIVAALSWMPSPGDELAVVSERFGFRVERPSEAWVAYGTEMPSGARYCLTLYPGESQGIPSFVVYVADWDGSASAEALRDDGSKKLEGKGGRGMTMGTGTIASHDAAWMRGSMHNADGSEYALEYDYLVEKPYVYVIQKAEHIERNEEHRTLDAIAKSFALFASKAEKVDARTAQLEHLAGRCGSEIEWCTTWACAAERAKTEGKIVLAVFENYEPLQLPNTLRSGTFMDPDMVALVNERFVAFEMSAETEAPFRDPAVFGLGKNSFGTSFLFLDAEGHVLRETGVWNASYLCGFARDVLTDFDPRAPDTLGPKAASPKSDDRLAAAEACLRRGELDRIEKLTAGDVSPRAHRLRAARFRQLRQGKQALDELHAARSGSDANSALDLDIDEAQILMCTGRSEEAEAILERVAKKDHARVPEAMFWLGAFEALRKGVVAPPTWWAKLVDAHPESPWAWKAAANLLKKGAFVFGTERLQWPEPELVAAVAPLRRAPLEASKIDRVEREAIAYLVHTQRADGTWISPADAFSVDTSLYTPAITAICGASLIPHAPHDPHDPEKDVSHAIERALARILELHASGKLDAGTDLAGVYSIWSRTYALRFCARCVRGHIGDAHELAVTMKALVDSIQKSRHTGGGWPYVFLPGDPGGKAFDPSASFLTAGVVLALFEARDAGADVSKSVLDDALRFLQRLRQDDGSFRYMPAIPGERVAGAYPEAAGRGPLCALTLLRGGIGDVALVHTTLGSFVAHRTSFAREWRKELCHTSPEGFGAHYIFYDYAFAAEAVRALPRDERSAFRAALLEDVLCERLADGSFEDLPTLGRAYGTAMALWTLRELRAD
jgi:hypothetical protein